MGSEFLLFGQFTIYAPDQVSHDPSGAEGDSSIADNWIIDVSTNNEKQDPCHY